MPVGFDADEVEKDTVPVSVDEVATGANFTCTSRWPPAGSIWLAIGPFTSENGGVVVVAPRFRLEMQAGSGCPAAGLVLAMRKVRMPLEPGCTLPKLSWDGATV